MRSMGWLPLLFISVPAYRIASPSPAARPRSPRSPGAAGMLAPRNAEARDPYGWREFREASQAELKLRAASTGNLDAAKGRRVTGSRAASRIASIPGWPVASELRVLHTKWW